MLTTMDDHTEAQPTTALDTQTQAAADQLAWSSEEPATELLHTRTWATTLARAVALVLAGGAAAVAVWAVGWHPHSHTPVPASPSTSAPRPAPATTPTPAAAPPPPAPAAPPPPQDADTLTPNDHRFLAQLDRDGIGQRDPGTEGAAVVTGHAICRHLTDGMNYADVQHAMTPYLTPAQADTYIQDAVIFYCPNANYSTDSSG